MKYNLKPIEFMSVKEMPLNERPREKMKTLGSSQLSDLELLCCALGSGNKKSRVQDMAQSIIDLIGKNNSVTFNDLKNIEGLGEAKASLISACFELGRRFSTGHKKRYENPSEIFSLIRHYGDRQQEHFIVVILNGALEVIEHRVVTVGLINKTLVHPREVFAPALEGRATAIIVAHNHPSGYLRPSSEDLDLTQNLINAGQILGVKVVDHLIFNQDTYISMAEEGIIFGLY